MKIAILGYAGQGQSSYEYWNRDGNEITICDLNAELELPEGVAARLGAAYLKGLDEFDLLVRTPALHPREIVAANPEAPDILSKVTANTDEFFRVCPSRNIIGVTGTKGKGTTSTLISRMLEAAGHKVHLGGNIGTPPLELLKNDIQPDDWVVLELANFQLIDIKHSPAIGICLMVEPEHLDWHKDIDEYMLAKQQMFRWQKPGDVAIYYAESENSKYVVSPANQKIPYMQEPGAIIKDNKVTIEDTEFCDVNELKLLGKHNWQNVCAAVTAAWQVTQDVKAMRSVLISFTGLPFRLELRKEVNDVRYYNDSFATAPGAAIAAMGAIPGPKVLILGGFDRGLKLAELIEELKKLEDDVRKVVVIGASGPRLADEMKTAGFDNFERTDERSMDAIVRLAASQAKPGDAVVLSPAFASFDMFKNFEERGNKFNEAVEKL